MMLGMRGRKGEREIFLSLLHLKHSGTLAKILIVTGAKFLVSMGTNTHKQRSPAELDPVLEYKGKPIKSNFYGTRRQIYTLI